MPDVDAQAHRKLAADAFNETWRILDKSARTAEDEARLVQLAFASRDHWAVAGQPADWARGEWQLSRVYSALRQPDKALQHARRCLKIGGQNGLGEFEIAAAHEAFVRAHLVTGDVTAARQEYEAAMAVAAQVVEPEDRAVLFSDLRVHANTLGIPWEH